MCNHYPERCKNAGIQSVSDVEVPERHHSCYFRWYRIPYPDSGQRGRTIHSDLDQADYHCPSCIWRCVQKHRNEGAAGSKAELVVTDANGNETRELIFDFKDTDGIIQGLHNKNNSIAGFARACFNYGLDLKQDVWFATKDTISKKYDHTFKDIFQEIYDAEYKEKFEAAGIEYFYTLIDDAVARVIRSNGGYIWACKNYDGDVMSDMVSTAYGSLAMMTSVLVSPEGIYEYEAAHGTVQRHYYKYLKGEETSTNSVATIFAWSGAMRKRGELDGTPELCAFADKLEQATIQTIEEGVMTGDLYLISKLENKKKVNSKEFLEAINERLAKLMQA